MASATKGLFSNAHHFFVSNSTMIDNSIQINSNGSFDLLAAHTIPGAEYDSYDRDPPPQCHPGTRLEILESIHSWVHNPARQRRLLWIHGPAGVGKSAIMQTLAENQAEPLDSILGATIFFSRPNKRDNPQWLFSTVAYQLAVKHSSYRKYVVETLTNNPRIVGKSMAEQFKWFVVRPFTVPGILEGISQTVLVVLDGLDEVKGEEAQREIVLLIGRFTLTHPHTPLIWAIASRPEPHIQYAFSNSQTQSCFWEISIPVNSDRSSADVERFLREKFQEIRLRYPSFFPSTTLQWPSEAEILTIANASSGFFIFASVTIRFIVDESYGNPVAQLQKVLTVVETMRSQGTQLRPLAILDNMYAEILSAISPGVLPQTLRILAVSLYSPLELGVIMNYSFGIVCNWLRLGQADVYGALRKLYSVMEIPAPDRMTSACRLKAFHASFPDYIASLLSRSRYNVDPRKEVLVASIRVLLESHNPLDSTIRTSRIALSWSYENQEDIQEILFHHSFINLAPNLLEIASWGDGSLSHQLRSFLQDIDYGKAFLRPVSGSWRVLWQSGAGDYRFLSALESWGLARPFSLQDLDLNRVRPPGSVWAQPISPLSEQSSSSAPFFLHWNVFETISMFRNPNTTLSEHDGWKDQVSEHITAISNLKIPACVFLVGRADKSAVVMYENADSADVEDRWFYVLPYDPS